MTGNICAPCRGASKAHRRKDTPRAIAEGWCIMAALLLLPGCSDIRDMAGFSREGPDEFSVITHQPLVIPPDFNLRPPRPGETDAERNRAKEAAEEALFSKADDASDTSSVSSAPESPAPASTSGLTAGEEALLQQLSDTGTPETQEAQETSSQSAIADIAAEGGDSIVDARAEAERLRANEEAGAAPTEGATPVVEDESEGSLLDDFWDLF